MLIALLVQLIFMPWAIGTMTAETQVTSLVLAAIGFVVALTAPTFGGASGYELAGPVTDVRPPPSALRRLLKFPPFWIGLALLLYIVVQGLNPSWRYTQNTTRWWMYRVPDISWLPTSMDVPFSKFNLWRELIIYATAWLTLCTVGIGLTRRRSFGVLLGFLAVNTLVLALVGGAQRLTSATNRWLWFKEVYKNVETFSGFFYKNHAAAYLCLMAAVLLAVAARWRDRALREHATSSPALLPVIGVLVVLGAVVFTYSRGGTLLISGFLLVALGTFLVYRLLTGAQSGMPRAVTLTVAGMVGFVVIFAFAQVDLHRAVGGFQRLTDASRGGDVSVNQRLEVYEAGRDMLAYTWPRGVGAGGFRYLFPDFLKRFDNSYRGGRLLWQHAHNDYLQIPIEQGAVGTALILLGFAWGLWRLFRTRVWQRLPSLLLALGLCQTLLHASFDFPFQNPAILTTWLVLAIVAVRYNDRRVEA